MNIYIYISDEKNYIGACSTTFKERYSNHKTSFKHIINRNKSDLSEYIWQLKENNINYKINWKILKHAFPYKNGQNLCRLCLTEKLLIFKANRKKILNKIEPLIKCKHRFKFRLKNCVIDS